MTGGKSSGDALDKFAKSKSANTKERKQIKAARSLLRVRRGARLTDKAQEYVDHITTDGVWGGFPEANAIAQYYGFESHIFDIHNGNLRLLTAVGAGGEARNHSLLWHQNHYQVITGDANRNNQAYADAMRAHNPVGDGNCMFEAIFYVLRDGENNVARLLGESHYREANVGNMRGIAASHMDPVLLDVLGNELDEEPGSKSYEFDLAQDVLNVETAALLLPFYKLYPPRDYFRVTKGTKKKEPWLIKRGFLNDKGVKLSKAISDAKTAKDKQPELLKYLTADLNYAEDPLEAWLASYHWKDKLVARIKEDDYKGMKFADVQTDKKEATYWDGYSGGAGSRSLAEVFSKTGPQLLRELAKKEKLPRMRLYKGWEVDKARKVTAWFNSKKKKEAEDLVKGSGKMPENFRDKLIPLSGHIGGKEQAEKYAASGTMLEFILKPGAHELMFDPKYMAIARTGKGASRSLAEFYRSHKRIFPKGSDNEGNLGGYIGMKSEQAGPFSLAIGDTDPTALLFQLLLESVEEIDPMGLSSKK